MDLAPSLAYVPPAYSGFALVRSEMVLEDCKGLLPQLILHEEIPESENRCLIRYLLADPIGSSKRSVVGNSIEASSISGSISAYHWCMR